MNTELLNFQCVGMNDGDKFPLENTGRGRNLSPGFLLENLHSDAKSLVITLEDLSHPIKEFTHWILWNVPPMSRIPMGIAPGKRVKELSGAVQGMAYGMHRYAGPKPPRNASHTYRFTIYALDTLLKSSPFSTKKRVLNKAAGHILQKGSVYGIFE